MSEVTPEEVLEAKELFKRVESWTEEDLADLPKFYRERARELQRLSKTGEE